MLDTAEDILAFLAMKVAELDHARRRGDAVAVDGRTSLIWQCMRRLAALHLQDTLTPAQHAQADTLFDLSLLPLGRTLDDPPSPVAVIARAVAHTAFPTGGAASPHSHDRSGVFQPRFSRRTHCWHCKRSDLDSAIHSSCDRCGGIRCPHCGACLCGFS